MPAYSNTPLSKKLGIKMGDVIYVHNTPVDYFDKLEVNVSAFQLETNPRSEILDFAHVFVSRMEALESIVQYCKDGLKKTGMIWVSWPKGSSKVSTDLKREPIREYMLDIGLVDVKVASYDDIWSSLKFVYRLKDR